MSSIQILRFLSRLWVFTMKWSVITTRNNTLSTGICYLTPMMALLITQVFIQAGLIWNRLSDKDLKFCTLQINFTLQRQLVNSLIKKRPKHTWDSLKCLVRYFPLHRLPMLLAAQLAQGLRDQLSKGFSCSLIKICRWWPPSLMI